MSKSEYNLTRHPLALLFPCPDNETIDRIKRSVFENKGVTKDNPVITLEGKVIQGWEEYSACAEFKLPYVAKEFDGDPATLVDYLLSEHKSQLSKHHRALIGAYLKKLYRSQSKANQATAGKKASYVSPFHARDAAAAKVQLSPRLITQAEKIIDSGGEKLMDLARNGLVSISCGAQIAGLDEKKKQEFFAELSQRKSGLLDKTISNSEPAIGKIKLKLEEDLRFIERYYKEKRQEFNAEMRQRLKLADTPEDGEKIKQGIINGRKNLKHFQLIKIERAKQEYEKARQDITSKAGVKMKRAVKISITEIVHKYLSNASLKGVYEGVYAVYCRWDYELGEIKLRAVAEKICRIASATDCYKTSSGRRIHKDEVIVIYFTMSDAEQVCQSINEQNFCRSRRIFRTNSWAKRIFNYVGNEFMGHAKQYLEDSQ